jgi:hypothetical protein
MAPTRKPATSSRGERPSIPKTIPRIDSRVDWRIFMQSTAPFTSPVITYITAQWYAFQEPEMQDEYTADSGKDW